MNQSQEQVCLCFEFEGDNSKCPKHGNEKHIEEIMADYYSDYGMDYRERNDLYMTEMGA